MYGKFYCGTSNLVLPFRNKSFYPEIFQDKSRLTFYSSLLNSIEINSTFYKLPLAKTITKWTNEVSEDFRFTFKMSKQITHEKNLNFNAADLYSFWHTVNSVQEKKGCILIQFPAQVKANVHFINALEQLFHTTLISGLSTGWRQAVEFRDISWYQDAVYELLNKYNIAIVMHDMPRSVTPYSELEKNLIYLRFHGENGRYGGTYPDHFLEEYSGYIKGWLSDGIDVYAYFNNTKGDAIFNVIALRNLVTGKLKM